MVTAAVAFLMMVVTVCSGRYQFSFQVSLYCLLYIALSSCAQFYSGLFKSCLSASADASADQYIYILISQEPCKSTVACAVGTDHFAGDYLVVFHLIHFKKLSFSKMLKYVSIVIGYCYLHVSSSSFLFIPIYSRVFSTVFLQAFSLF